MYSALDIACAVVNHAVEQKKPVSNLKLQKILYFIQGYHLADYGEPLFEEEIEAWPYGPVVVDVYNAFQRYGSNFIPRTFSYKHFSIDEFAIVDDDYDECVFTREDLEYIYKVTDKLADYGALRLVDITHAQDPWRDAIKYGNRTIMDNKSIKSYFDGRK